MQSIYSNSVNWSSSFKKSSLLLFFIWPVASLFIAFRNYKEIWAKNILWLFCIFFGYTFIISDVGGADSDRYARTFLQFAHSDLTLSELWSSFYSESSNYVDIASPLITYLVSRFTDSPNILFAVFGLVFGYFYSRNIWLVLDHVKGNMSIVVILFILTFSLCNSIWNINGFRMNAAAQIFLYGGLRYLLEDNFKGLLWAGVSVLFHFSFLFPLVSLFVFILLKNKLNIYLIFFLLTSLIKEVNIQSVQSFLSFLPDIFQSRVSGYTNIEYAEAVRLERQSVNWYVPFSYESIQWVVYIITMFIYFTCRQYLKTKKKLMTLFCYSLLLYGFANIASQVPTGTRFIILANTFMLAIFIIFISTFPKIKGLIVIKLLSIPLLLFFCIVTIRMGMDFYSIMTFIGNPISVALYKDTVPFINGIKSLFL